MEELLNNVEKAYAEYCRARGISHEQEAKAFKAYQDAVKAVEKAEKAQAKPDHKRKP